MMRAREKRVVVERLLRPPEHAPSRFRQSPSLIWATQPRTELVVVARRPSSSKVLEQEHGKAHGEKASGGIENSHHGIRSPLTRLLASMFYILSTL